MSSQIFQKDVNLSIDLRMLSRSIWIILQKKEAEGKNSQANFHGCWALKSAKILTCFEYKIDDKPVVLTPKTIR